MCSVQGRGRRMTSQIPATIKGSVIGTADPADAFGIVAELVSKVKIGRGSVSLADGPGNDFAIPLGSTDDVRISEVTAVP